MPTRHLIRNLPALSVIVVAALLSACQTNRLREISEIEKGMSKAQVLGVAGGPQRSGRKGDEDQWLYIISEERRDVFKEVRFREGRVSYVGDVIAPQGPSAAEQDRLNAEANEKSEAERRRDQLLQEIGRPATRTHGAAQSSETLLEGSSPAVTKPVFVPIDEQSAE